MIYRFGDCTLDTQRHRLQRAGQPVRLRAKAFQVLLYLLTHRDRTVLKQELYDQIWPQQFISEATLESTVRAVRQAVGDTGRAQQFIQTVYGYGYRFSAAVEELAALQTESDAKTPVVLADAVAFPLQGPSDVPSLPPAQSAAIEPNRCVEENGGQQEKRPLLGTSPQSGEWKLVTLLCCAPAVGGAQPDAELRYRQLSHLYALAQPMVRRYGGTFQPVLGDHLLIVFGAPMAQEDHAQRAVLTAFDLRRRLQVADTDGRPPQDHAMGLRIGLCTGQVAVGGMGDAPAWFAAVVGDTVMRALALLAQAAPGTVLCCDTTARLVQRGVRIGAVRPVLVAREGTSIPAYRVMEPYEQPHLLGQRDHRMWSPFIGRQHELATLYALLAQVEEGRGQVVGVIGEPGVGKSRLCYEFIRGSILPSWLILEAHGAAHGQTIPYLPIIDLLKGYFLLEDRDDRLTVTHKVTSRLLCCDATLKPTVSALLALLDVPVEDPQWRALEASQRRQRTLEAVKRLLLWECQGRPVLLIVENLHWIDTETQAMLDLLVESLPASRLFLLTSYRPEYQHRWGSKTSYTQLRLDPLSHASAYALLNALLGDDPTIAPLKQRLGERTQGNPFFMEESIRSLVETQILIGTPGAYRVSRPPLSIQVPATVQAVLAARIDRLPAAEKHLLQCAAAFGREVSLSLLQAIAQMPAGELHRGLAHLRTVEFVYETRLFPEPAYTFKHALMQEVAYSSLLHEWRRALHLKIVDALEAQHPERLGESAEHLAQHALRGEVWEKAVLYCRQAGEKAQNRGAFREAVTSFEQALDAFGHLPERPDTGVLAVDLRQRLGNLSSLVGEHTRSLALLGEAEARARHLGDRARLGRALCRMVTVRAIVGDVDGALAAGREALELAATLGDPALQAHASFRVGRAYASLGDYTRAAQLLRANVAALARSTPGDTRFFCLKSQAWLPQVLSLLGEFVEGRRRGEEALRLALVDGQWQGDTPIMARAHLGCLYLAQGDLAAAIRVFKEGLALCRAAGERTLLRYITGGLGEAYALTGRVAEGLALLEEARRDDLRTGALGGGYVTHLRQLSAVSLLDGRVGEAQQHARQALDLAREQKTRGQEALALCQLGDVHAHASPPDVPQAEARYREALTRAEALGMRPLQAHCHRGLGTLYARLGRREQACAELSAAIELYRAMDMTLWLIQAEAALAHIGGGGVPGELHAVSEAPHVGEDWTRWMPPGPARNRHGA
jgi:DNA-binding winged helix-turn-helix (wHTH) protein/tetratricopeptide (TPR) repeat protein/class 3 adenylate cyclase